MDTPEPQQDPVRAFLAKIGKQGGSSTSERKRASSKLNAAKALAARLAKRAREGKA